MENSLRKDRLLLAQNYALYYGHGQIDLLSRFDVAIVEPKAWTTQEITLLRKKNTLVFAYISIMEVHPDEFIYNYLKEEDFLTIHGKRVVHKQFGTSLINLRSKRWIDFLLEEFQHRYIQLGVDGIFIDTIGDIEMIGLPPAIRNQQVEAVCNLLAVVKLLYPKHLLIQNNGLEFVSAYTAPYLDGICWENPPLSVPKSSEWVQVIINRVRTIRAEYNLKVLLLVEELDSKERKEYIRARKTARENDFLLYYASKNYVEGVNFFKG